MSKDRDMPDRINQGIQADSVEADVLAVGSGARATKYVEVSHSGRRELKEAVRELKSAVEELAVEDQVRQVVSEELDRLGGLVDEDEVDREEAKGILSIVADKLDQSGVVLTAAADFLEPAKKLAKILGFSLAAIGVA